MLTTLLTTTPPHLVTLTSLLSAVKEGVAVGVSAQGMDDNSPGLSQQEFKEKPHFWSPQSPSIMLWQLDVCVKLLRVRSLNITALFDGVITSVCDLRWLFTAFDNEWNVISCTSAVGNKHSHKTDHRSPPSLYERTDFSRVRFREGCRHLELPACLPLIQNSWPERQWEVIAGQLMACQTCYH